MKIARKRVWIYVAVFVIWIILGFVQIWLKTDVKMFGENGLQKLVLHIVIDEFRSLFIFGYFFVSFLSDVMKSRKASDTPRLIRSIIFLIVLPALFYLISGKPALDEQYVINNINSPFPDIVIAGQCVRDLDEDLYDEFLVNGCILEKSEHCRLFSMGKRTEYTARFTYNGQTVVSAQAGYYLYKLLEEVMPVNSDTTVKIYRNSGFIRNVTPIEEK